jgi:hypothetical protein
VGGERGRGRGQWGAREGDERKLRKIKKEKRRKEGKIGGEKVEQERAKQTDI